MSKTSKYVHVKICYLCGCKEKDISYFTFPKELDMKKKWMEFCECSAEDAEMLGKKAVLCEKHFEERDIVRKRSVGTGYAYDSLILTAVPKIYDVNASSSDVILCDLVCHEQPDNDMSLQLELNATESSSPINVTSTPLPVEESINLSSSVMDTTRTASQSDPDLTLNSQITVFDRSTLENMLHNNCIECSRFLKHITSSVKENTIYLCTNSDTTGDSLSETPSASYRFRKSGSDYLANQNVCTSHSGDLESRNSETTANDSMQKTPKMSNLSRKRRLSFIGDIKTPDFATPKRARRSFQMAKAEVQSYRKKYNVMQKRMARLQNKVTKFDQLLKHLDSKQLISKTASLDLQNLPESMKQMVDRQFKNKNETYPPELRSFALTVHFYSSQCYKYVRSVWNNLLPHEETLRQWYSKVDGSPGITKEALHALKMRTEIKKQVVSANGDLETVTETYPAVCALIVDEISIKDHIDHDRKKVYGYQDLGTDLNLESDTLPHAQHALVFLLVSLKEPWKVPVAYFLIHSLTGEERANLVRICLKELWYVHVHVVALTFDGTSVNITMCNALGAKFSIEKEPDPVFEHPISKEPIFIYPDPCHMLKLVRNTLAEKGPLFSSDANEISWSYIEKLQKLEDKEGLRAATKLTKLHIDFSKNKMNVRLAAQILSNSVKKGLLWAFYDMHLSAFKDTDATAEFCGMLNDIFDQLNIRSRFCKKPSQIVVRKETLPAIKKLVDEFIAYLQGLMVTKVQKIKGEDIVVYEKLVSSSRKTGFMGLIICLKNIVPIYERICRIPHHVQPYLLTYKLLQDSIENFFSAIRSRGGYNNNPTARSFAWAYKKLLVHHEVRRSGNCSLDDIQILCAGKSGISTVDPVCSLTEDCQAIDVKIDEDGREIFMYEKLSRIVTDVNHHMAGFVVMNLIKNMKVCYQCEEFLEVPDGKGSSKLTKRKDEGYLRKPTVDVCKVTEMAERIFRSNKHLFHQKNLIDKLILKTYIATAADVFNSEKMRIHAVQQELFHDHKTNLIKLIAKVYLEIRFHHECRRLNIKEKYVRQISNRSVNIIHHQ